jgi:PTS system galactitol-specific IIC component
VSLILVPIAVFLAVILPGNTVLPFADLAVIPWMFVLITPLVRDNGFRALVIGVIVLAVGLLISTNLSPLFTQAAINAKFTMPDGAAMVSSICDGANPLTWVIVRLQELGIPGLIVAGVVALGLAFWNRTRIIKEARLIKEAAALEVSDAGI